MDDLYRLLYMHLFFTKKEKITKYRENRKEDIENDKARKIVKINIV